MTSAPAATIVLTSGQTSLLLFCLLTPPLLVLALRWHHNTISPQARNAPDWSIPTIDAQAEGSSLFHAWTPAVKIGALLLLSFLIVALRSLFWSAAALVLALVAVGLARIPWQRSLRRLAAMSGLCVLLLLVMPLSSAPRPGDTLLLLPLLGGLSLRLTGFFLALTITCKAAAVALLMEPMFATAPLARTLQGFTALGLPPALTQMILLCHRYLFVFQQELARMHRAMRVRGFVAKTDLATLRTTGNGLGMLFIRSFERTERVYEAMLSRGYRGGFPAASGQPITSKDLAKGVVSIIIGMLLLALDRRLPLPWL